MRLYDVSAQRMEGLKVKGVPIYEAMPKGWRWIPGTYANPLGYRWAYNGKSRFGGEYRHGLVRDGHCI